MAESRKSSVDVLFLELSTDCDPVTMRCMQACADAGLSARALLVAGKRGAPSGRDPCEVYRIHLSSRAIRVAVLRRISCYLEFVVRAILCCVRFRPRVLYTIDIHAGLVGLVVSRLVRTTWAVEIKELWADKGSPALRRAWSSLERLVAVRSHRLYVRRSTARLAYILGLYNVGSKARLIAAFPPVPPRCNHNLRSVFGIPANECVFVFMGTADADRGVDRIIRALKEVHSPSRLVVLGEDGDSSPMAAIARASGVEGRVSFCPRLSYDEAMALVQSADVGVASYLTCSLNIKLCASSKAYDYVVAGLPIMASNQPELKALVEENRIGLTFDPDVPATIVEAMEKLASDPRLRAEFARSAALMVDSGFNWDCERPQLAAEFRSLSERQPAQ